jgi:16S rRNA (guanine527-N7)-methyltransferase
MLGRRPIRDVIDHARAFVDALTTTTGTVLDLGSGGGVPGLVIAVDRPDLHLVLVERRQTRADHLVRLVGRLELTDRVSVRAVDAERLHDELSPVDAVVARGFGGTDVTLRAAVPLLTPGGRIVVSEPPQQDASRWAPAALARYRLERLTQADRRVVVLRDVSRETDNA